MPGAETPSSGGLVLEPFRALRYAVPDERLADLTSPPYDVIGADERAALEAADPHNVVRLVLPREPDPYARAAATLAAWRAEGTLRRNDVPALHVYEQRDPATGTAQRGLVGALRLRPYDAGVVLPHEDTMKGPVADRLALYTAVEADLEPIFLVHDGDPVEGGGAAAREVVASVEHVPPAVSARLGDGLDHRLWALTDPDLLAAVAADLAPRTAVIADGHHRYATYLQRQRDAHAAGRGAGPWDLGLTLLVDAQASGPQVHAIHRVVPGEAAERLAARAVGVVDVRSLDGEGVDAALGELAAAGERGPAFLLASGDGSVLRLLSRPDPAAVEAAAPDGSSAAWRALDVAVLHTLLVRDRWALPDTVEAVGFEHDVADALAAAARTGGTAVLLNPTPVAAVTTVAGAGERMPRKSTLFTPKPRTGLLIRPYA